MNERIPLGGLQERQSVRFALPAGREGFAFMLDGVCRAYLNQCVHRAQPVDVGDGQVLTKDGFLECGAHGALYNPVDGSCAGGPCTGGGLTAIKLERDGDALFALALEIEPPEDLYELSLE